MSNTFEFPTKAAAIAAANRGSPGDPSAGDQITTPRSKGPHVVYVISRGAKKGQMGLKPMTCGHHQMDAATRDQMSRYLNHEVVYKGKPCTVVAICNSRVTIAPKDGSRKVSIAPKTLAPLLGVSPELLAQPSAAPARAPARLPTAVRAPQVSPARAQPRATATSNGPTLSSGTRTKRRACTNSPPRNSGATVTPAPPVPQAQPAPQPTVVNTGNLWTGNLGAPQAPTNDVLDPSKWQKTDLITASGLYVFTHPDRVATAFVRDKQLGVREVTMQESATLMNTAQYAAQSARAAGVDFVATSGAPAQFAASVSNDGFVSANDDELFSSDDNSDDADDGEVSDDDGAVQQIDLGSATSEDKREALARSYKLDPTMAPKALMAEIRKLHSKKFPGNPWSYDNALRSLGLIAQ